MRSMSKPAQYTPYAHLVCTGQTGFVDMFTTHDMNCCDSLRCYRVGITELTSGETSYYQTIYIDVKSVLLLRVINVIKGGTQWFGKRSKAVWG